MSVVIKDNSNLMQDALLESAWITSRLREVALRLKFNHLCRQLITLSEGRLGGGGELLTLTSVEDTVTSQCNDIWVLEWSKIFQVVRNSHWIVNPGRTNQCQCFFAILIQSSISKEQCTSFLGRAEISRRYLQCGALKVCKKACMFLCGTS